MEKIFLKPTQKEILVKGSPKEGHLDVFSYDYNSDEAKRKLGNLYIVGNIQQNTEATESSDFEDKAGEPDVAYVTNLIASLAKREYYSNTDISPKEAFSATLKKINDVVDDFFVNKDLKINVGIFALAGENINISKIGKFKIILARDDKNIDILNNIDLFTKERVEEKEFSHVVSGRITHGDKILAFYPGRLITAREKTIKENFLKLSTDQFVEKIEAIKAEKNDFSCAALCINLNKIKEPTVLIPTLPIIKRPNTDRPNTDVELTFDKQEKVPTAQRNDNIGIGTPELPRIIRSEFSLGKKDNPFAVVLGKIKMFLPKRQNKMMFFVSLGVVILLGAWAIKSFFIISPSQRQTANAVSDAQNNIKLAKTKINQNDFPGARNLLLGSIANISSITQSDKSKNTKDEMIKLLDNLDQATESSPVLAESLPKSVSDKASLIVVQKEKTDAVDLDIYEGNLYFIAPDGIFKIVDVDSKPREATRWLKGGTLPPEPLLIAVDGKVYVLNKSGLLTTYYKGEKESEINTLVPLDDSNVLATTKNSQYLYLINKNMGRIYLVSKATGTLFKTIKVPSQEAFTNAYLDQDEIIYLVSKDDKIWKVQ